MYILITNNTLDVRAGSEMYVHDLSIALKNRGHDILCYSPKLGPVAEKISLAGVRVVDDLRDIAHVPDIIHAQHYTAAAAALFSFPQTPAIFVCHGSKPWQETPLIPFAQIRRYVAVDSASRGRLVQDLRLAAEQIRLIQNGVDTRRFFPRRPNKKDPGQRRALIFSNYAEDASIAIIREACAQNNISLDVRGHGVGKAAQIPEFLLCNYDLVFAKARAAMEAMACGAQVILADYGKWGGAVCAAKFDVLRDKNFGLLALDRELDVDAISAEIATLDWSQGDELVSLIQTRASLDQMVESLLSLYIEVIEEGPVCERNKGKEIASFLYALTPLIYERDSYETQLYEETKKRSENNISSAALLAEAAQALFNSGQFDMVKRLAHHALVLHPEHPVALALLDGDRQNFPA